MLYIKNRFPILYLIPFILFLTARTIVFDFSDYNSLDGESPIKTYITYTGYIIGLSLMFFDFKLLNKYNYLIYIYMAYFIYSLITILWVDYPAMAAVRLMHMFGNLLVCLLAAEYAGQRFESFLKHLFLFYFTVVTLSVIVSVLLPQRGVVNADWADGELLGSRWVGVTGHPNLLGAAAIIMIWISLCRLDFKGDFLSKIFNYLAIILSFIVLVGSDSRTSMYSSAFFFLFYWVFEKNTFKINGVTLYKRKISINKLFIFLFTSSVIIFFVIYMPEIFRVQARSGGDGVFSGRIDIWAAGIVAIKEFPFGWGQDQLMTYWNWHSAYLPWPHFHNGFLDVYVRSGLLGGTLLMIFVFRGVLSALSSDKMKPFYVPILAFCWSFIVYNIFETALDRETAMWMFFVLFACLAHGFGGSLKTRSSAR